MDYITQLKNLPKQHDYFVGFDSDGTVFDTMELKHGECFCPAAIKLFGLQPASRAAREVWEFVTLYSETRGCNRFFALRCFRELLRVHQDVQVRDVQVPEFKELDTWVERATKLDNPALILEVEKTGNGELKRLLDWSLEVNERITDMVLDVTPFPGVLGILERVQGRADMIVVSQAPLEAVEREWKNNKMDPYVKMIAGREHGSKREQIHFATEGKGYDPDRILVIGDAPSDFRAARENNALFFPIIPRREEMSWKRLLTEGIIRFFEGRYAGTYQQELLEEFDLALSEIPWWVANRTS